MLDANGTRHHLLLGRGDWGRCLAGAPARPLESGWRGDGKPEPAVLGETQWDSKRHELTLRGEVFRFTAGSKDVALVLANRRGAACDRYGNFYWIADDGRRIRVRSSGSGEVSDFWPLEGACEPARERGPGRFADRAVAAPGPPGRLRGLAVTTEHYLVAGTLDPAGLLVFDLHAGGAPRVLAMADAMRFAPFDMTPRPCGGVWILDGGTPARLWKLSRTLEVLGPLEPALPAAPDAFQPAGGGGVPRLRPQAHRPAPLGIPVTDESGAPFVPIAIESLPDGTLLLLENRPGMKSPRVVQYGLDDVPRRSLALTVPEALLAEELRAGFVFRAHDFAFVREQDEDGEHDRLVVATAEGNQAYVFELAGPEESWTASVLERFVPMRRFTGKGLVSCGGRAYYDSDERWLPLVPQRRPQFAPSASFVTPILPEAETAPASAASPRAFDGREPGCVWHRLLLDGCVPAGTSVSIESRAADSETELASAEWHVEPTPYLRGAGSEVPFAPAPASPGSGTWELLFQRARGRFLQLRITLAGDRRGTPRLRALRAYYPRFSYLEHYLPGVYRSDPSSASFLDRFLANAEGMLTGVEDRIANVRALLGADTAPPEALDWLAGWLGLALDPSWTERQRRFLIRHAMEFFEARGTVRGLRLALAFALWNCTDEDLFLRGPDAPIRRLGVRVVELFRTRRVPARVLGDPSGDLGPRAVRTGEAWSPALGASDLLLRYGRARGLAGAASSLPLTPPADAAERRIWREFALAELGFEPSGADAAPEWRAFLKRRYRRVSALNQAHLARWTSFDAVAWPSQLPANADALLDWFEFETIAMASRRLAHRFRVLLPAPRRTEDLEEQDRLLALANRIVRLEKPAHTSFDVKFYWALFRLGDVRLGEGTQLSRAARSSWFLAPLVAGRSFLAEGVLAPGHPRNVPDRFVVGRDRVPAQAAASNRRTT